MKTIKELRASLKVKTNELAIKRNEAFKAIEEEDLEKAKELTEQIKDLGEIIKEIQVEIEALEAELEALKVKEVEEEVEEEKEEEKLDEQRSIKGDNKMEKRTVVIEEKNEERAAFENYLETRAIEDGLTLDDGVAVIPHEVVTEILELSNDKVKLSDIVTVRQVKTGSGTLPIRTESNTVLATVEQLKASPELAVANFDEVDYKAITKRAYIPISQELADDGVNVVSDLKNYLSEVLVNTDNNDIMNQLKKLTNKNVKNADELKEVVNVKLPVGSDIKFLLTQTVYNHIDQIKDKNGRYLFQDSISAASGKSLFGRDVVVINDTDAPSKETAFVGNFKQVVLFERSIVTAQWINYLHYGECLSVAKRSDVQTINEADIIKFTFKPEVETTP